MRYMFPIVIGCYVLFRAYRLPVPLNVHIIPHTSAILVVAAILCIGGVGFCFWARAVLGRNWSGSVTLKENHELIVRGPYRLVRHPIYTGLLAMVIATVVQQGHIGGIIGLSIIFRKLVDQIEPRRRSDANNFPISIPPIGSELTNHSVHPLVPTTRNSFGITSSNSSRLERPVANSGKN